MGAVDDAERGMGHMPDRLDPLAGLAEQGHAVLRRARSAAQVTGGPGSDPTGSVHVMLNADGRVAGVTVAPGRRRKIDAEKLAEAVVDVVRDAAGKRLHAWGHAYSDDSRSQPSLSEVDADADRAQRDRDELQRRLQQMATAPMSGEDRRAALSELLALAEAIERGIDEVSSIQRVSRLRRLRCSEYSPTTGRGLRFGRKQDPCPNQLGRATMSAYGFGCIARYPGRAYVGKAGVSARRLPAPYDL